MPSSEEQLLVLRYVEDHPGCNAYEIEADLGDALLPVLQELAGEAGLLSIGAEYEDWMGCGICLEEEGEAALAAARRAQGRPMRRKERQLSQEAALEVLDRCTWAALATVGADGAPYCVPLNLVRDGMQLYFHTALEGHKVDNLRTEPAVCVTAVRDCEVDGAKLTTYYRCAVVHGTAQEITDPAEKREALRLLCQRFAPDHMALFEGELAKFFTRTGVWRIQIDRITGKGNFKQK